MSEMLERVAIVLAGGLTDWNLCSEIVQHNARCQARAAIAAMREPPEKMLDAGWRSGTEGGRSIAWNVWQAMIDAALEESL